MLGAYRFGEKFSLLHRKDKKKCGESTKRKDDGLGTGGSKTISVNHPEKKASIPRSLSACVQNRPPFPLIPSTNKDFDCRYYLKAERQNKYKLSAPWRSPYFSF